MDCSQSLEFTGNKLEILFIYWKSENMHLYDKSVKMGHSL